MPPFPLMLLKLISRPISKRDIVVSLNYVTGLVVEFHLRALRVLRGVFLQISNAEQSFCTFTRWIFEGENGI